MDEQTAREKALIKSLITHCEKLEEDIKGSLPWEVEMRMERVRVLKRDLESETANLEEGFNRLNSLYTQEIKSGDEAAVFDRPITRNDGEVINAQILKIGNQWLVYADEEGKKYGVLQRVMSDDAPGYKWKEELSFAQREAIREALDVKTAKKPPKLVTLPLSLSLENKDQKKGEE
jgi:hypothetical protein